MQNFLIPQSYAYEKISSQEKFFDPIYYLPNYLHLRMAWVEIIK